VKRPRPQDLMAAVLVSALALTTHAKDLSSAELNRRTVERRAVDAVIWGLPLVGEDAVKQAAFRDGKAKLLPADGIVRRRRRQRSRVALLLQQLTRAAAHPA